MHSPPRVPPPPVLPERRHGGLRMLASSCIISAWLSLVLSLLFGFSLLAAPAPSLPTSLPGYSQRLPGGPGFGSPGLEDVVGTLPGMATGFRVAGALMTIAGGLLSFFFLAALGQGLYLLLDMEENTRITAQALAQIARRMGQ